MIPKAERVGGSQNPYVALGRGLALFLALKTGALENNALTTLFKP